jgi:pimeloyl-ACP methyl ester carboxylesterase
MHAMLIARLLTGFASLFLSGALCAAEDPLPHPDFPPAIAELSIDSGGHRLPGLIYLANGPGPHPTVLLLHGFPGNEKNLDIAQDLRRIGFNVLFFHYRGAWGAEGSYSIRTLDDDVLAVLDFLRQDANADSYRVDRERLSLLGHSLGGYTALAAGRRDREVQCVAAMAPANPGAWMMSVHSGDRNGRRLLGYADSLFMLRDFDGEALKAQLRDATMEELDTRLFGAGLAGKSVLLVVGEQDRVTPAAQMFHPVVEAYAEVPGLRLSQRVISGDHSFSWSRIALSRLLQEWFAAHCGHAPAPAAAPG